jgi:short-subunit dehydrogenase
MEQTMKPIDEQVMVITGASSGIGLSVAQRAAQRGARVVLSSRAETRLQSIADDLHERDLDVYAHRADVTERDDLEELADAAEHLYGGIDTWFNNAGSTIFGPLEETDLEDARKLFDINYWGVVHGSEVALPYLRRSGGGTLINMGSALSDRSLALQGHYSASKQAVKAYTNALRMELEKNDDPIAVSLVLPSSTNTKFAEHAKNLTDSALALPPPIYSPEVVARAVLDCAKDPQRDLYVGAGGRALSVMNTLLPRFSDWVMEQTMFDMQMTDQPKQPGRPDTLYEPDESEEPASEGTSSGGWPVFGRSLYTRLKQPVDRATSALMEAGLALVDRGS